MLLLDSHRCLESNLQTHTHTHAHIHMHKQTEIHAPQWPHMICMHRQTDRHTHTHTHTPSRLNILSWIVLTASIVHTYPQYSRGFFFARIWSDISWKTFKQWLQNYVAENIPELTFCSFRYRSRSWDAVRSCSSVIFTSSSLRAWASSWFPLRIAVSILFCIDEVDLVREYMVNAFWSDVSQSTSGGCFRFKFIPASSKDPDVVRWAVEGGWRRFSLKHTYGLSLLFLMLADASPAALEIGD